MENEVCENCGRAIGKLEEAFVCKGHVVCKECNKKLSNEPQEIQSGRTRVEQTPAQPNAQRGKMTKSKILWLAFAGWSVLFVVLILSMLAFYSNDIATRTHAEQLQVRYDGFDPARAAASIWFVFLAFIWFIGALPLFIAAIVTRKDKKLSKLNT
jgi:hypothetical protein